ncbi:LOW QUALITY PROTEIN: cathelicidin-B1-like [Cygnus atratus]|uniref:LOW QUALITY PROTEIN: cathelicidin-B1-like n=1 Tax=Cygnus atratus TaxID=8868 RepID=UPI0021B7DC60|nr:LOW QUALITY PROTEIN: cathelicidin-B1-like [Cygnus atratus]
MRPPLGSSRPRNPKPDTSPVPGLDGAVTAGPQGSVPPGPEGSVPPGQDGSLLPTRPWRWPSSSLQAVLAALRLLHRSSPGPCALRLRVLQRRPGWLGAAQHQQELTFLVQDAWCQPTGTPATACRSCHPQVRTRGHGGEAAGGREAPGGPGAAPGLTPPLSPQPGRSWGAWIRERWAGLRQRLRERGPLWTRGRRSRASPARP